MLGLFSDFLLPLFFTWLVKYLFYGLDAAEVLRQNRRLFEQNVMRAMKGGYIGSTFFERCLR